MRAHPLIEAPGMLVVLTARQPRSGGGIDDLDLLAAEIVGAHPVQFGREPRRIDQCEPAHAQCPQCPNGRQAWNHDWDAACPFLQARLQGSITLDTQDIATAEKSVGDCMQRGGGEKLGGIIDGWRLGERAYWGYSDPRVSGGSRHNYANAHARRMNRNSRRR